MPDLAVDIGNTRIKWGVISQSGIEAIIPVSADDPSAWSDAASRFVPGKHRWIVANVHPKRRDLFVNWAENRGDTVHVIQDYRQLPIEVQLEAPERVGIDRLLDAVAANRRKSPGSAAIIVDAGTAITINFVDQQHRFRGGYILPGRRILARSLHQFTAQLPEVTDWSGPWHWPPTNTQDAIREGISHLIVYGVQEMVRGLQMARGDAELFITGGDGAWLIENGFGSIDRLFPALTLEGIAESRRDGPD
jgi:type III pantothenate kinase